MGRWFEQQAREHGGFELRTADLAEIALPFLDEPQHPARRDYTQDHTRAWSAVVDAADAVALVMPEYNYGYTAPLKNALDFLYHEWAHKPVGFVSYGGLYGGTRAVQLLKPVLLALSMVPVNAAVNLAGIRGLIGEDGELQPAEGAEVAAAAMLDELRTMTAALQSLR